jgi:hypothetical protein
MGKREICHWRLNIECSTLSCGELFTFENVILQDDGRSKLELGSTLEAEPQHERTGNTNYYFFPQLIY